MLTQAKFSLTVFVIISIVLAAGSAYAVDPPKTDKAAGSADFPYLAQPVSDDVNIRSGGGTAYYPCGKLKLGENITVVAEEFGWAKIVPPKGSFSWIAKKYIKVDPDNPKVGFVKGDKIDDEIRVWVGSPVRDALISSTTQTKLSEKRLDIVELLGGLEGEQDGYLKIAPPAGAFLYVSASNLKYIGPVGAIAAPVKKVAPVKPDVKDPPAAVNNNNDTTAKRTLSPPTASNSPGAKKLIDKCREIANLAEAEKEKPFTAQDYSELKKAIALIAKDSNVSQAKAYAEYLTRLINRYELVAMIDLELKRHADIVRERKKAIEAARAEKIAGVGNSAKYITKGIFRPSNIFTGGQRRYLILDDNYKIICYAIPGSYITPKILEKFHGKKVGLEGSVMDSTSTVGLVKFTGIEKIAPEEE